MLWSLFAWATCIHDNAILYGANSVHRALGEHEAMQRDNVDVDWERCTVDRRTPLGGACATEP